MSAATAGFMIGMFFGTAFGAIVTAVLVVGDDDDE